MDQTRSSFLVPVRPSALLMHCLAFIELFGVQAYTPHTAAVWIFRAQYAPQDLEQLAIPISPWDYQDLPALRAYVQAKFPTAQAVAHQMLAQGKVCMSQGGPKERVLELMLSQLESLHPGRRLIVELILLHPEILPQLAQSVYSNFLDGIQGLTPVLGSKACAASLVAVFAALIPFWATCPAHETWSHADRLVTPVIKTFFPWHSGI